MTRVLIFIFFACILTLDPLGIASAQGQNAPKRPQKTENVAQKTASAPTQQCTPGEILGCSSSNTGMLEYCGADALIREFNCPSKSCSKGTCDNPIGNVCQDAIQAKPGHTYNGTFAKRQNSIILPPSDRCQHYSVLEPLNGPDVFYAIELNAGDILDIRAQSEGYPQVYVMDSCSTDLAQACLWSRNVSPAPWRSGLFSTRFYAPTTGTYYVVVGTFNEKAQATYSLDLRVQPGGLCQPDGASCNPETGQLSRCDSTGMKMRPPVTCTDGCSGQSCNQPGIINNNCSTAYDLGGASRIVNAWPRFTQQHRKKYSCDVRYTGGRGAKSVYSITMQPGEVLFAQLKSINPRNSRPTLFVTTDCNDATTSCGDAVERNDSTGGENVSLQYYSEKGGKIYLFAESEEDHADELYLLEVDLVPSECTPGEKQCLDNDTQQTCNKYHLFDAKHCDAGCDDTRCNSPPNDTCTNAEVVPNDGIWHTYTGNLNDYTNTYDLYEKAPACKYVTSMGPDAVYAIDVVAGDVIEVDWQIGDISASVWITTNCSNHVESSCVAGIYEGNSSRARLTYTAQRTGRHYIVGDGGGHRTPTPGDFQIAIRSTKRR